MGKAVFLSAFSILILVTEVTANEPIRAFVELSKRNNQQLQFALSYAESLLRSQQDSEFELLATGDAVNLLTEDASPEALRSLVSKYPRVRLVLCKETKERPTARLLPQAELVSCSLRKKKLRDEGWVMLRPQRSNDA